MSASLATDRLLLRRWANWRQAASRLAESSLLRHSALAVLDQAVVSGTSFATSVLLARFSTREEVGLYYLALSMILLLRGIQEQVICAPYMVYCHQQPPEEQGRYAGSILLHHLLLVWPLGGLLGMAAAAGLGFAPTHRSLWVVVGWGGPLILLRECVRQMAFAHLKLKQALWLDGAACALQLGLLGGLAVWGHLSVTWTLAVLALAAGLPAVGWLWRAAPRPRPSWQAATRDLMRNWRFARWALASHLLASLTPYLMPWVVAWSHGTGQTGLWGVANTLAGLSNIFLMGLCNSLGPRAARAYASGGLVALQTVLLQTAALFAATLGLLCLAAWCYGEWAAMALFGPHFAGIGPLVGLLTLSVLVNSLGVTAGNGLWAMDRPRANFVADAAALVVIVTTTAWWVPGGGPLGAAAATLAGTSVDALIRLAMLRAALRHAASEAPR